MVFKHFLLRECSKTAIEAISLRRKAILRVYNTVSTAEYQIKLVFFIKSFVLSPSAGWHCFSLESFVLRCNPLWPVRWCNDDESNGNWSSRKKPKINFFLVEWKLGCWESWQVRPGDYDGQSMCWKVFLRSEISIKRIKNASAWFRRG